MENFKEYKKQILEVLWYASDVNDEMAAKIRNSIKKVENSEAFEDIDALDLGNIFNSENLGKGLEKGKE